MVDSLLNNEPSFSLNVNDSVPMKFVSVGIYS